MHHRFRELCNEAHFKAYEAGAPIDVLDAVARAQTLEELDRALAGFPEPDLVQWWALSRYHHPAEEAEGYPQ